MKDDIVPIVHETDDEIYYRDGCNRYCFLYKSEKGEKFAYVKPDYVQEMSKTCNCNNKKGVFIKLMPDYESSGLWCAKCGVMLDKSSLDLPKELVQRIKNGMIHGMNIVPKTTTKVLPQRALMKKG